MKRILALASSVALALAVLTPTAASAHTPFTLLETDTTAAVGPLIADGTVTFAVKASFKKAGDTKGFRATYKKGDQVNVEYLVADKKPDRSIRAAALPTLTVTSPSGKISTLKLSKGKKYYEKGTKTKYLVLSKFMAVAEEGTFSFDITATGKATMTVSLGKNYGVKGKISRIATDN